MLKNKGLLIFLTFFLLTSCGRKGALYLENKAKDGSIKTEEKDTKNKDKNK